MKDIKAKIRKLMNLAQNQGATEAEATQAMEMATSLMMRYNITLDVETDELRAIKGHIVMEGFDEPWHIVCASAAAYLYACKIIIFNKGKGGYQFIGRPMSIEAAELTLRFIVDQVEQQYKLNLPKGLDKPTRAEFRRCFKAACAQRVATRSYEIIDSLKRDDNKALEYTGSKALVVIETFEQQMKEAESLLDDGVKLIVQRPKRFGYGTREGFKAGDNVELNRKVKV